MIDTALIAQKARSMTDINDLLSLLNEVKACFSIGGGKPFAIGQLKALCGFSSADGSDWRYTEFAIKKKSGGERTICAPVPLLKAVQRCLNIIIGSMFEPHTAAHGFVKGRSVASNAREHAGRRYVYNIDLEDFFPSINYYNVMGCLEWLMAPQERALPPYLRSKTRTLLIRQMALLCCKAYIVPGTSDAVDLFNPCGKTRLALPQGAPTSPVLSNLVFRRIDERLSRVAYRHCVVYSRYADDITFSCDSAVPFEEGSEFLEEVRMILRKYHFSINASKTRLQSNQVRQEVTGLTVNEKPNVTKRYVREVRTLLYAWRQYGYAEAASLYARHHKAAKGELPPLERFIEGKLLYLKMVKGAADTTYMAMRATLTGLQCRHKGQAKPLCWLRLDVKRASLYRQGICQVALTRHTADAATQIGLWDIRPYGNTYMDMLAHEHAGMSPLITASCPTLACVWHEISAVMEGQIVVTDSESYRLLAMAVRDPLAIRYGEDATWPECMMVDAGCFGQLACDTLTDLCCNVKASQLLRYNEAPNKEERKFVAWCRRNAANYLGTLFNVNSVTADGLASVTAISRVCPVSRYGLQDCDTAIGHNLSLRLPITSAAQIDDDTRWAYDDTQSHRSLAYRVRRMVYALVNHIEACGYIDRDQFLNTPLPLHEYHERPAAGLFLIRVDAGFWLINLPEVHAFLCRACGVEYHEQLFGTVTRSVEDCLPERIAEDYLPDNEQAPF